MLNDDEKKVLFALLTKIDGLHATKFNGLLLFSAEKYFGEEIQQVFDVIFNKEERAADFLVPAILEAITLSSFGEEQLNCLYDVLKITNPYEAQIPAHKHLQILQTYRKDFSDEEGHKGCVLDALEAVIPEIKSLDNPVKLQVLIARINGRLSGYQIKVIPPQHLYHCFLDNTLYAVFFKNDLQVGSSDQIAPDNNEATLTENILETIFQIKPEEPYFLERIKPKVLYFGKSTIGKDSLSYCVISPQNTLESGTITREIIETTLYEKGRVFASELPELLNSNFTEERLEPWLTTLLEILARRGHISSPTRSSLSVETQPLDITLNHIGELKELYKDPSKASNFLQAIDTLLNDQLVLDYLIKNPNQLIPGHAPRIPETSSGTYCCCTFFKSNTTSIDPSAIVKDHYTKLFTEKWQITVPPAASNSLGGNQELSNLNRV